ncbi:MAG: hypothetical protein ABI651_22075, partial [Verrucomicrobiota bacterium]
MNLERLVIANAKNLSCSAWHFAAGDDSIRKWTLLPRSAESKTLFGYVALACAGTRQASWLGRVLPPFEALGQEAVRVESVLVRHAPQECGLFQPPRKRSGWKIAPDGTITPLTKPDVYPRTPDVQLARPHLGAGNGGWLFLGYGGQIHSHANTDAFDFADPRHRLKRFASLFDSQARLTDPLAFLERLHLKGVVYERGRSLAFLTQLSRELSAFLNVPLAAWLNKRHNFRRDWQSLSPVQQTLATVALDAARHVLDASVRCAEPFDQSGVLVLDGAEEWCPLGELAPFVRLLDSLLPNLQFLLALSERGATALPPHLLAKRLPIPRPLPRPVPAPPSRLPPGTALLVDIDSRLPNLALMKLSRHLKDQGKRVVLERRDAKALNAEAIYASCVFAFSESARRVEKLRQRYGSALHVGGSGVDIKLRLPPAIENLPADYSLYPELGDRAIGFLTRGCPLHCPFCIVPIKEGKPRLVSDFDSLLQDGRKKLILLDDNILSHATAVELLEEMLRRDLQVNFNQTLDLRLLKPETAGLLRRIRCSNVTFTRRNYYFSLNNTRSLDLVRSRYDLLQVTGRDNVEFVCMYGFDTTLADDVKRFQFLRSLPGAYVFLQRYRPVLGGPDADLSGFFDERADEHIDALLRVNFTQNMKSVEVYYRWLCLLYARSRGRVHRRLVETLFRYNARHRMGQFLAKLENLCQQREAPVIELTQ